MTSKHAFISTLALLTVWGVSGCTGAGDEVSLGDDRTDSGGGTESGATGGARQAGEGGTAPVAGARAGGGTTPVGGAAGTGGTNPVGGAAGTGGTNPVGGAVPTGGTVSVAGAPATGSTTPVAGAPSAGGTLPVGGASIGGNAGSGGESGSAQGGSAGSSPVDPCKAAPDSTPCDLTVVTYYFDQATGSCTPYAGGTCGVGPNSFHSLAECMATCAPSTQCVVAGTRELPCCDPGVPILASDLAESEDLVLYPFFGFPEECELVECHQRVASRIATPIDESTCGFADECQSVDDCMMLIDSSRCCPCPIAFPRTLPQFDRCWVAPGEPAPEGCAPSNCVDACNECPGHVLACEEGYPEPYRLCNGVLP
ncbi:MAG: hypothetical protein JW751_08895 [Polyangiaceae bacterium]|nr:hypothetical protein [Polyangiaceae bacterium]